MLQRLLTKLRPAPAQEMAKTPPALPQPRGEQLPILSFEQLVARHGLQGSINSIRQVLGFADINWQSDALPLLCGVAEYVQQLPASESHHHAQPGGLLIHLFEVCQQALKIAAGKELPPGISPEERLPIRHRWNFAVMVVALLHDVGKPVSDLRVSWFGKDPQHGQVWNALTTSLTDIKGASHYLVRFPPSAERCYDAHSKLGILLYQRLLRDETRAWLAEESRLMATLLPALSGDADPASNVLMAIVSQADQWSVKHNLEAGSRVRFASAQSTPLIERLMLALRSLLAEGELPLNKPGAAGWVVDGQVYLVAKRIADEVRGWLQRQENPLPVPADNERLFDAWQDYQALFPNPANGRAIWRIAVQDGEFAANLTVIVFPVSALWSSGGARPASFAGRLRVIEGEATSIPSPAEAAVTPTRPAAAMTPPANAAPSLRAATTDWGFEEEAGPPEDSGPPDDGPDGGLLSAETVQTVTCQSAIQPSESVSVLFESEPKGMDWSVGDDCLPPVTEQRHVSRNLPKQPLPPMAPATLAAQDPGGGVSLSKKEWAMRLLAWVQAGVSDGSLSFNVTGARIHFVEEGMLLISPVIFRDFAESLPTEDQPPVPAGKKLEQVLQRACCDSKLFVPRLLVLPNGKVDPQWIHPYVTNTGQLLHAMLFGKPSQLFNPVPQPNPHLVRQITATAA
ncbi:MobH family relaxase [Parachitinimonas caeni]|uniref:MobH family relaxase n=1 Tax=Parachitinimonas caeni TaxID=3031301 RepID=A0ABT7E1R4_9NEIS|nr:MobH family relaxase [Parachitinimonas caeni]MDK2126257.1 MobH family relaxase [Parachitinimonas caeni]